MSLEISERDREGIAILDCSGRLVLGAESEGFQGRTAELIKGGKVDIILIMRDVAFIDSTGLGAMIALSQRVASLGGQIKVVDLTQPNVDLLVITKLTTVFELFDDEQEAVNSFFPDRKVNTFDLLSFVQTIKEEKE